MVEPLYFRQDQLGFVLFEADPGQEEVYELLRGQISGALKRTQLVARNVELYNEAVKARVAAEAGRRLAEDADQLKSRFLATVSHELRTPLSLIVGTIEMMQREEQMRENAAQAAPLPAGHRRDLASIHSSAQHLARLIADVLDLASSQAGELRLVKEPLRLSDVLAQVVTLAEPMARERGLAWQSDIPAELPTVVGDRTRLQQVALNLVSNAIKFTEQGSVSLWVDVGRRNVVVAVSDTGIGIPVAEQEIIFDEFRQSKRAARRGYGGMGLGLAISRRLVELHGGQIGLLSSGTDGAGSTFYFTLPILAPVEVEPQIPINRDQVVLLLTERAGEAARLRDHLAGRGFTVETLSIDGHPNWLAQIVMSPPGAVVLDYEPAAERGWELMQHLKLNPATREIPVLFYTISEDQDSGAVLALDYLAKPVDDEALMRALARQGIACESSQRKTVLVVDDDPSMLELHARILRSHMPNCRVLKAHNGVAALAVMAETRPDLVLLDLMMPEMDGFGVLRAMQENERVRGVPVIVLTAQILTREDMARLQERRGRRAQQGDLHPGRGAGPGGGDPGAQQAARQRDAAGGAPGHGLHPRTLRRADLPRRSGAASGGQRALPDPLFSPGDRRHPHRLPAPLPRPPGARAAGARSPERHRRRHGHRLLRQQLLRPRLSAGSGRDRTYARYRLRAAGRCIVSTRKRGAGYTAG